MIAPYCELWNAGWKFQGFPFRHCHSSRPPSWQAPAHQENTPTASLACAGRRSCGLPSCLMFGQPFLHPTPPSFNSLWTSPVDSTVWFTGSGESALKDSQPNTQANFILKQAGKAKHKNEGPNPAITSQDHSFHSACGQRLICTKVHKHKRGPAALRPQWAWAHAAPGRTRCMAGECAKHACKGRGQQGATFWTQDSPSPSKLPNCFPKTTKTSNWPSHSKKKKKKVDSQA